MVAADLAHVAALPVEQGRAKRTGQACDWTMRLATMVATTSGWSCRARRTRRTFDRDLQTAALRTKMGYYSGMSSAKRPPAEPPAQVRSEATEMESIRHDLKNLLTAFRSGCLLIGLKIDKRENEDVHALLDEMRAAIETGSSLSDRLRRVEHLGAAPAVIDSESTAGEVRKQ
tara:strand:+ start:23411 stop:23929 length:519 start_codon:yes stop_codon:yes gene_type:complete